MRNCYAAVSVRTNVGSVDPVVYNGCCLTSYYDKTLYADTVEGRNGMPVGVTTAEMKDGDMWRLLNGPGGGTDNQGNADENLNRSCRDWGQQADINGGYPVPRGFLHEEFDLWTAHAADAFAGGDGTQEKPYEISTPEQLAKLAEDVNSGTAADGYQGNFFVLTADLNLAGKLWEPIGFGRKNFRGSFDGGLHTISGMTVRDIALPKHRHMGLFGCVNAEPPFEGDSVRNPLLTSVDIQVDLPGNHWVGSLAGSSYDRVERCGAQGTITAVPYVANLGGLMGWSDLGGDSCFFRGTITAGTVNCHSGLIGRNHHSILENSYAAVFFPADTDFAPVRKNVTVKVKKPPVLTITDNPDTTVIEVQVQYAEAGWCIADVYTADGQMVTCGQTADAGTEKVFEKETGITQVNPWVMPVFNDSSGYK